MKLRTTLILVSLALAGCDGTDRNSTASTEVEPNAIIDADPTPQTGSGGSIPLATPDGTVNGAPGEDALADQPTPTD